MSDRSRKQIMVDTLASLLEKGVPADEAFRETTYVVNNPDIVTVLDFDEQILCEHHVRCYKDSIALCPDCGYMTVYNELPITTFPLR